MEFAESFRSSFLAVGQVAVLGVLGFYILKRGILGQCCLRTISNLVIQVTLPLFMFTNIVANFDSVRGERWYVFPLYCLGMFALAVPVALAVSVLDRGMKSRREFVSLVTFQNSGFLPIILTGTLLPPALAGKVFIYIFLFLLFYNPVLFTLSESIFSGRRSLKIRAADFFNAASTATVAALALALLGWGRYVPDVVFKPLKMVGDSTIPLSIIVVGGIVMVNFSSNAGLRLGYILKVGALKLVALPLAVAGLLALLPVAPEVRFLLVIEAMMPPAALLPLLAGKYEGDYLLVGQTLFGTTLLSLVTVPLLITALRLIPGV